MKPLFSDAREANLRSCVSMVEDVLQTLGHSAEQSRVEGKDAAPAWKVRKGSASVYILVVARGEENLLRIVAPVLFLEDKMDRPRLFQRMLELNHSEVYGAAFALDNDAGLVVLVSERLTVDLDRSEVLDLVKRVEEYADRYDDILVDEFGGKKAGPSSMPVDDL